MDYILEMKDITKTYPGVKALSDVKLQLKRGEVHALLGENGAGKSTLVKVLSGVIQADSGEILLAGKEYTPKNPQEAIQKGMAIIHQERSMIGTLTAAQNIWLGREKGKAGFVNKKALRKDSEELLKSIAEGIPLDVQVQKLSSAQQQLIEIAKAVSLNAEIIIMDEPTSSLTEKETEMLFKIIRNLKANNKTIIYISHRMKEIETICDRATILRDGTYIDTVIVKDTSMNEVIRLMVGRDIGDFIVREKHEYGEEILRVNEITRKGAYENISFSLHKGEILGFAGLVGAGRTEVMRGIFGADKMESGELFLEGKKVKIKSPNQAIMFGIGLVPEERKSEGAILNMTIEENITVAVLKKMGTGIFVNKKERRKISKKFTDKLRIKTPSVEQKVLNLSGGNQQKVVLAKWLAANPKILILDEPTRGIDIGAKREIYHLINELAQNGIGIIVVSSEMAEILGICDNLIVMSNHKLVAKISRQEATEEKIMDYFVKEV